MGKAMMGIGAVEEEEEEDDNFFDEEPGALKKLKNYLKLLVVLSFYGFAFVTMIDMGFWLSYYPNYEPEEKQRFVEWFMEIVILKQWTHPYLIRICVDGGLITLFTLQHSFMTVWNLKDNRYWQLVRTKAKMDRPLYVLMTACILQIMMHFWQPIPIYIWEFENSAFFQWLHIFCWALLYGTTLMLDLPEMIGLNQVIIQSRTVTLKSPKLYSMYQKQRHMGFLPLTIILVGTPFMSLDRLILSCVLLSYQYLQWRSDSCYDYAKSMKQAKSSLKHDLN